MREPSKMPFSLPGLQIQDSAKTRSFRARWRLLSASSMAACVSLYHNIKRPTPSENYTRVQATMFGKAGKQYANMIGGHVENMLGDHLAKKQGKTSTGKKISSQGHEFLRTMKLTLWLILLQKPQRSKWVSENCCFLLVYSLPHSLLLLGY